LTLRDPIVFFVYGAGDDVVIQTPEQIAGMGLSEAALLEACGGELKRHEVHLIERFCQDNETAIERAISFYSDGGLYRQEETRRAGANIAQYVKRWTLTDDDGAPLPHTEAGFGKIAPRVAGYIYLEIRAEVMVGKRAANAYFTHCAALLKAKEKQTDLPD
jgi:hypothetical protein